MTTLPWWLDCDFTVNFIKDGIIILSYLFLKLWHCIHIKYIWKYVVLSPNLCLRLGAPNRLTSYLYLGDMGTYDHIQLIFQESMCLRWEIPSFCHIIVNIYIYIQFNGDFGAIPSWILTHLFSHMICTYAILMCSLHPKLISSDETHTMRKVGRLLNWEFQVSPLCCAYPPNDTKYLDQPKHSKVCESLFK